MCSMNLNTIEPSLVHRIGCSGRVPLDVLFDLVDGERPWWDGPAFQLHVAGTDIIIVWRFRFQLVGKSGTAYGPELAYDERAFRVYGVRNLSIRVSSPTKAIRFLHTSTKDLNLVRTFFHAAHCSSDHIPGTLSKPPACGAMKVPSETRRVPGTEARWV